MTPKHWLTIALVCVGASACGEQAAEQTTDQHGPPMPPAPTLLQEVADSGPEAIIARDTASPPSSQR